MKFCALQKLSHKLTSKQKNTMNSPVRSIKTKPSDESTSSNEMNIFSKLTALAAISSSSPSVNDVNNVTKKVVEGKQILKPYKQMHKT